MYNEKPMVMRIKLDYTIGGAAPISDMAQVCPTLAPAFLNTAGSVLLYENPISDMAQGRPNYMVSRHRSITASLVQPYVVSWHPNYAKHRKRTSITLVLPNVVHVSSPGGG